MKAALIIEDEIPAAERLSRMLKLAGIDVVGSVRSNADAVRWLSVNPHPDLIFADISLQDGKSFKSLQAMRPESLIVFVSAYDQFALEAFVSGGYEYLLKPVTQEKLEAFKEKLSRHYRMLSDTPVRPYRQAFLVASGHLLKKVDTNTIPCFISENNTTFLIFDGRHFPISQSLEKLENDLDPELFFRISRRCIVNRNHVDGIVLRILRLRGPIHKMEHEISRSRYSALVKWLQK